MAPNREEVEEALRAMFPWFDNLHSEKKDRVLRLFTSPDDSREWPLRNGLPGYYKDLEAIKETYKADFLRNTSTSDFVG